MIGIRALLWILLTWHPLVMHFCYAQCVTKFYNSCNIGVVNMSSDGGAKLRKAFETGLDVHVQKMIVAISPSGPFLQRFASFVDSVSFNNYREATFHVPDGNTIGEISVWNAPAMRTFVAGSNTQLETLNIVQCQLDRLPQTLPKMTKLKSLTIRNCKLLVLRLDTLIDNQNLKNLELSYNEIRHLIPVAESPGRKLSIEKLVLAGNQLTRLDMAILVSMPQIFFLLVLNNRIELLEVSEPITIPKLLELNLEQNQIASLDLRNLTLPNLETLSLGPNVLTRMPSMPKSLPKLNFVSLYSNNITQLDLTYFRPYSNLETIDVSYSQITAVRTSSPVRLSAVSLDLRFNQITTFNITGCDMPNITSLLLGGNRLTVFPAVYGKYPNIRLSINWDILLCDTLLLFKERIQSFNLMVDQFRVSSACSTISFFLTFETIQKCCGK